MYASIYAYMLAHTKCLPALTHICYQLYMYANIYAYMLAYIHICVHISIYSYFCDILLKPEIIVTCHQRDGLG